MKVYTNIESFEKLKNPVVTIGTFDGVHNGHRKILKRVSEIAKSEGGQSVVFTFFPHPRMVLFPDDQKLKLLSSQKEKIRYIETCGIDHLVIFPFTRDFSRTTAVEFVRDTLVNKMGMKKLVIGYDHQFGRNREGSIENLKELAPVYGFTVEEIPAQLIDEVTVSSTKIRKAILEGDIEQANKYLGHPFEFSGMVVAGKKLGRTIGFPTANLSSIDSFKIIPGNGVYAVSVETKSGTFKGMMNIGVRPTVSDVQVRTMEVHLFDFDKDIYNEIIQIKFFHRLRNEIKFNGVEELKTQLEKDKEQALQLLNNTVIA